MRKTLPLVVLLATAAFVPMACGKKDPVVPTMTADAGLAIGDGGADAAALTMADAAADAAPVASGSAAPSGSVAALAGPALDAAIDLGIQAQAAKDAPGMSVEGTINHTTLAEGAVFNSLVTLQPGRCYTIIAASAPLQVSTVEV